VNAAGSLWQLDWRAGQLERTHTEFLTLSDSCLVGRGTPHQKAEVAPFEIAIEASLAQPDSNRVRAAREGGFAVSPVRVTPDGYITNQAVVVVPQSRSSFDVAHVCLERKGGLLVAEDLLLFHITRTLRTRAQIRGRTSCPPASPAPENCRGEHYGVR